MTQVRFLLTFPLRVQKNKVLIFLSFFILSWTFVHSQTNNITISSGAHGGNYNKVGQQMCQKLNELYDDVNFKTLSSGGSFDNIKNLGDRVSDLAIIQRDVFIDNIYDENTGIKNIEIVCPLFQEALLIYVKGEDQLISFEEFAKRINSGSIQKIGVGKKNSFTEQIMKRIFNQYDIQTTELFHNSPSYTTHIEEIKTGTIQAIAIYSAPLEELQKLSYGVVGFNRKQIDEILIYQKNASIVDLSTTSILDKPSKKQLYTLGTWALLVGLTEELYNLDNNNGPESLLTKLQLAFKYQTKSKEISNYKFQDVINYLPEVIDKEQIHTPNFLEGLPLNPSLSITVSKNHKSIKISTVIFYCFLLLVISLVVYLIIKGSLRAYWIRYRHFVFSLGFVVAVYFASVHILLNAEKELFEAYNIKSGILDIPREDLHIWLITSTLTKEYNNIFPLSVTGKFIVSLLFYLNIAVVAIATFMEVIIRKTTLKRRQGKMKTKLTNHLVICGWNTQTTALIEESYQAIKKFHRSDEKIVCITKNPDKLLEQSPSLEEMHVARFLHFVDGDAKNEAALSQCQIDKAKAVILLSEDNTQAADEKTLLRALSISRYCRKKSQVDKSKTESIIDSIYLIAEINDTSFNEDLKRSDVNEIVCTASYGKNILIQSMLNHGVSHILNELLTFNEHNEFYSIDLTDSAFEMLHHKTFDELLLFLRKYNILLIGIKAAYFDDENNIEVIDDEVIAAKLAEDKLVRQYIINPHSEVEIDRKTDDNDQLLVLCTNGKVITNLAKELKKLDTYSALLKN